jgi:hypothetical protein
VRAEHLVYVLSRSEMEELARRIDEALRESPDER